MRCLRFAAVCMPICFFVLCLCLPNTAVANDPSTGPASLVDWMVVQRLAYRAGNLLDGFHNLAEAQWVPKWLPVSDSGSNNAELQTRLELLKNDNDVADGLATWIIPASIRGRMSRFMISWFRMWFLNVAFYLLMGAVWCYYVYFCFGKEFFERDDMPSVPDMFMQMKVAISAMHWYALKDAVTTYMVENGYSKVYARIDEVGLGVYFGYFILYMIFAEFWVYWAHRLVHDVPWLYKNVHQMHHSFNKADSLSPFAGIAHHPLDGTLQVLPYSVGLFIFPIHYFTHYLCLVNAMLWTHNLHDCIDSGLAPLMGAGFHTVHHTTYVDNYGQFFVYFDWLFGTLTAPEDLIDAEEEKKQQAKSILQKSSKMPGAVIAKQSQRMMRRKTSSKKQSSSKRRALKNRKSRR